MKVIKHVLLSLAHTQLFRGNMGVGSRHVGELWNIRSTDRQ